MFSVYCEKMNQAGLDPAWIGVLGVLIGAVIGFTSSYYTQKWQHENNLEIEHNKTISKLYADFTMSDLFKYIDLEVDYIQQLYYEAVRGSFTNDLDNGKHREQLTKHKAMLKMFGDEELIKSFDKLLNIRVDFHSRKYLDDKGLFKYDPTILLDQAAALAGEIKVAMFQHCSIKQ